jgi:hypothetical protein
MTRLTTYIGEKKALVFPVMCDGYLKIDYSQEVAQENYGIFGHDKSVTIETILTPYDVNGLGYKFEDKDNPAGPNGVDNSIKTMPALQSGGTGAAPVVAHYQSHLYLNQTDRLSQKMVIFHNDGLEFYLLNNSITNHNQPAEYHLGVKVVCGSTTDTLQTTLPIFTGKTLHHNSSSASFYHSENDSIKFVTAEANVAVSGHSPGDAVFTMTGANDSDNYFFVGQELFVVVLGNLISIGRVTIVATSGKTVNVTDPIPFDASGLILYTNAPREAPYLLSSTHLAATYDATNGNIGLYHDGELVASKIHTGFSSGTFVLEPADSYIGQDPDIGIATQFMGELHEFAILSGVKTEYNSLYTLAPNFKNVLIYYRFEETDL